MRECSLARDDGLLIKPEPRKPWVRVAIAAGVLAVVAAGYVAYRQAGKPAPRFPSGLGSHDQRYLPGLLA